MVGRLTVDRLGHHKTPAIVRVTEPAPGVLRARLSAHRDEQGIVEFLRPRDVVAPDHDMAEHSVLSSSASHAPAAVAPQTGARFAGWGLYDEAMIGEREKSLPSHHVAGKARSRDRKPQNFPAAPTSTSEGGHQLPCVRQRFQSSD